MAAAAAAPAGAVAVEEVDVAIIGGGPCGLAIAKSLLNTMPGTTVKVLEASSKLPPMGAGVLLNINGFRALKAIDRGVFDRLESSSITLGPMVWHHEHTGAKLFDSAPFDHAANIEKFGVTQRVVPWYEIRQALYDSLPEGVVELGTRVTTFEALPGAAAAASAPSGPTPGGTDGSHGQGHGEGEGGVLLDLGGGRVLRARLLVGADGYFSRVRKQVLDDGPPDFTGRVTWRARLTWAPGELPPNASPDDAMLWIDPAKVGKDRFVIVYPVGGGEYVWTATSPVSRLRDAGHAFDAEKPHRSNMTIQADGGSATSIERCTSCFGDYPSEVRAMLAATPPETVTEHGFYSRLPTDVWGEGVVTLAGDAAHVAPPDGQGCNLALEDAVVLVQCLQALGFTPEALRRYEVVRTPRVRGVLSKTEGDAERQAIIESPFLPVELS